MDIEEFKQLHSETIYYCQRIEHDLKWIYSYMRKGNQYENFEMLGKTTLGALVKKLKELDNSDNDPFISNDDYNFLKQMAEKRNCWCHQCFIDFIYENNFIVSPEYQKVCNKLIRDHSRFEIVSNNVEKVRLKAVESFSSNLE